MTCHFCGKGGGLRDFGMTIHEAHQECFVQWDREQEAIEVEFALPGNPKFERRRRRRKAHGEVQKAVVLRTVRAGARPHVVARHVARARKALAVRGIRVGRVA